MIGRGNIHLTPAELMLVLRGAKLTVLTDTGRYQEGQRYQPILEPIDLFSLRIVFVLHEPDTDTILITLSGVGLPEWSSGHVPMTMQYELSRHWPETPAEAPATRLFDLEDEA